jgi:NAD(P)-dependent dehydrogenase (short-subunit alcohol dehydrogenase family)
MSILRVPPEFAPTPESLAGRRILITGATGGLGRALCLACARAGATVILCGRHAGKLERLYDEITAAGAPQPAMAVLDLATATAAEYDALARVVATEFGSLDGVVHAAALLGDRTPLEQYDVPTWCKVLHVNLTAPVILTQVLLPQLRASDGASVVFVSSGVVTNLRPFWGAYAVSKSALETARGLFSQELERLANVRFNSLNPGRMRTPMRAAAYPGENPNMLPEPASVTGAFVYLLSAASAGVRDSYFEVPLVAPQ